MAQPLAIADRSRAAPLSTLSTLRCSDASSTAPTARRSSARRLSRGAVGSVLRPGAPKPQASTSGPTVGSNAPPLSSRTFHASSRTAQVSSENTRDSPAPRRLKYERSPSPVDRSTSPGPLHSAVPQQGPGSPPDRPPPRQREPGSRYPSWVPGAELLQVPVRSSEPGRQTPAPASTFAADKTAEPARRPTQRYRDEMSSSQVRVRGKGSQVARSERLPMSLQLPTSYRSERSAASAPPFHLPTKRERHLGPLSPDPCLAGATADALPPDPRQTGATAA